MPSGWKATAFTPASWSVYEPIWEWLATSQILTVLSSPPLTARRESGENLAERTQLECPLSEHTNFLLGRDQILQVLSSEAVMILLQSLEKETERTPPV